MNQTLQHTYQLTEKEATSLKLCHILYATYINHTNEERDIFKLCSNKQ